MGIPPEEPLEQQSYRSTRRRTGFWKRTGAIATSFITVTGMMLGAAVPANAAPDDNSEALGKFLGGEALGINLDDIAEVNGALAENPSGENPLVTNPLGAEVLNALNVDLGDGIQLLGENGVIQLGAVNQYAEAQNNGDAFAASGAVSDQGAIGVGGSSDYPSNAQINMAELLPDGTEGLITDLSLELGALSSSIEQSDGEPVTDYEIAGATLNLASPAVGGIYTDLLETVDDLQETLDGLSGTISNGLSANLDLGGLANLSTDVNFAPPNLSELLPDEVVGESSGVTVDLTTGQVTVDLEALLAADADLPNLNEMGPNSELLSGEIIAAVADGITQAVTDVVTEIVGNVQNTIGATELGLTANVNLVGGLAGIQVSLNADIQDILDGESEGSLSVTTSGAISLLNPLLNLLGLGEASQLGDTVFNLVGGVLGDSLDVLTDLESVVDGITGPLATEVVGPVLDVVNNVISVTVNEQPEEGDLGTGSSTVRAAQVTLLPAGPLAQVNLASSTVRGSAVTYEPSVSVDPSEAEPGESVDIAGSGFVPNSMVDVVITDADGDVVVTLEGLEIDGDGDFTTDWDVPGDVDAGELTVTVTDTADPEVSASERLTVLEAGDADADATDADADAVDTDSDATDATDADGTDSGDVDAADAVDTDSGDADGSDSDSSVTVDPDAVVPGDEVTIDGENFGPGESVTIEITDKDGNVIGAIGDVVTDKNGNFSVTWTVPEDVDPGVLTITVTDESGNTASAELTISESVSGSDDNGLASTGATATLIATGIALLLIVIGAALVITRRNNRMNELS